MKLTEEQISDCIESADAAAKLQGIDACWFKCQLRNVVHLALAAEPETVGRPDQWFVRKDLASAPFGPVETSSRGLHFGGDKTWLIYEVWIQQGLYLRIPPPPAGQDLKGWQCRVPVKDEPWYMPSIDFLVGVDGVWHKPVNLRGTTGQRRWIPPEPETVTPDRTGQLWNHPAQPERAIEIIGPPTNGVHPTRLWPFNQVGTTSESFLITGQIPCVRIPPLPAGQDLKGWQCREPVKDEPFYSYIGNLRAGGEWKQPADHPECGRRRWIPPKPDLTPWPERPYIITTGDMVRDATGHGICSAGNQRDAKAIAHALTELPKLLAACETIAESDAVYDGRTNGYFCPHCLAEWQGKDAANGEHNPVHSVTHEPDCPLMIFRAALIDAADGFAMPGAK